MKSVVVEASTVAKAIELAWQKAEKPEEFFIRILQEHNSGFLGFGAQKAKIALFFKNTSKSDSLFPVVLKQKEYDNLFNNSKLQTPVNLNSVDDQLNKNMSVGQHQKKKHNNQHNQTKNNSSVDKVDRNQPARNQQQSSTEKTQKTNNHSSVSRHKTTEEGLRDPKNVDNKEQSKKQDFKSHHDVKPTHKNTTSGVVKNSVVESPQDKSNVLKNVTHALKKVQSGKIIANVSRPHNKPKPLASDKAGVEIKKEVVAAVAQVEKKPQIISGGASVDSTKTPIQRFKRRPLNTENSAVSGIVRLEKKTDKPLVDEQQKHTKDSQ